MTERPGRIENLLPPEKPFAQSVPLPAALKEQWLRDGYVVLPGVYSREQIARYNAIVAQERLTIPESKDEFGYGERIGQLHQKHSALLDLAVGTRILDLLRFAFGDEPTLFASLNFERGTEQKAHIDAIFFYPQPSYSMAGCWIALEDVNPESGPLFYVPGSHRWPFSNGEDVVVGRPELAARREAVRHQPGSPEQGAVVTELANTWTTDFLALQAEKNVAPVSLLPKAGDAVIWHSLLAHGGSPRLNRSLSRKSVVFHYIGAQTKLYTFGQFFLKNRAELAHEPPQAVPLAEYKGLRYMRYGHYVSYNDGKELIHMVDTAANMVAS